jgi:hypothetical protein
VSQYNTELEQQLQKRNTFYNQNILASDSPNAFGFLSQVDPLATPLRSYAMIDENYLLDKL